MKTSSVILPLALLALTAAVAGQQPASAASTMPPVGPDAYQIQVNVRDAEAGAAFPNRNFSFTVLEGSQDSIQTGDLIPIKSSSDHFTYQPVGFKMTCQLPSNQGTKPGQLRLDLLLSISAVVPPAAGGSALAPVLRSTHATIKTAVPLGTATSVAEIKDAAGKSTYNVEVLATRATP